MSTDHVHKTISRIDLSLVDNVDMIGRQIAGRWKIVQLLGQGKMSTVYKAEEEHTGKPVVLKLLHKQLLENVNDLQQLEEGARSLIALNHENIANFYDVHVSDENEFFLCCNYLPGQSLASMLLTSNRLSVERATRIFVQVADALIYAHSQNILHKDLKPSNIFLLNDDVSADYVRVVDFGIARLICEIAPQVKADIYATGSQESLWRATYLSPEQCTNKTVDARSDIYSLGCVMYECLNSSPPFSRGNLMETAYQHSYTLPDLINDTYAEGEKFDRYQAVIMKMLEKNPADRYQSMLSLKDDLELLISAKEEEWKQNALVSRFPAKRVHHSARTKVVRQRFIIAALFVSAFSIFLIGSNYLNANHQETRYAPINNRLLWALKDKKIVRVIKDFDSKRMAALADLKSVELSAGKSSKLYEASLSSFCNLLLLGTDWSNAIARLRELLEVHDSAKGSVDPTFVHSSLALCYFAKGYLETAEYECQTVLTLCEQGETKAVDSKISALNILGDIYTQRGEDQKAKEIYLKIYTIADKTKLRWPPVFGFACARLADAYRRLGDLPKAEEHYKEAVDWWRNYVGGKGSFLPRALYGYGLVLIDEKQYSQAQRQFNDAVPLAIASTGQDSALVGAIKQQYSNCLFHTSFDQWLSQKMNAFSKSQ
jgi:serine/threonine protein kinase